jgi:SagB-type dehydrogenase family enzyme
MGQIIELPKPDIKGAVTLEKAIVARRSRRDFLPDAVTLQELGQLCWAAQGQDRGGTFRTVPSAGATYPLELFVVTEDGFHHYLPAGHALERMTDEDLRSALSSAAWGQGFVEEAPLTLVFAAEFERTTGRYGERGLRYVYMEAGHAAQNVHLQAEAIGLGSVAVGAFDDALVARVLSLPGHLEPIYMVVVGHPRK